jgi:FdhD protein
MFPDLRGGTMPDALPFEVTAYGPEGHSPLAIEAIRETPLTICLNGREVVTLLCTARHPRLLAVGFLKSDGLLDSPEQLADLDIADDGARITAHVTVRHDPWAGGRDIRRSITSGCGKGTSFDHNVENASRRRIPAGLRITPAQILALAAELKARSTLYGRTRGCHNASLCIPSEMLIFREDIGRHNAIDMLAGECFLEGIGTADKLIVSTGRVASEILLKCVRMGVPALVSTAVATSFSVDLARRIGLTLIGNVTADGFWIYNDPGRIVAD